MKDAEADFEVGLKIAEPKFAAERRFIASELAYVRQRIEDLEHLWRPITLPVFGVFRKQDWQDYAHQLKHYGHELDKHEQEIAEEWLPFVAFLVNVGKQDDSAISVKLVVEHGTISEKKKAPQRPDRLDAGARTEKIGLPRYDGFVRSGVKIGEHALEAKFSRLEAGKSAELTRQTLYLHHNERTRLHFELSSKLVDHLVGDVYM